jgi:hypothetical protein
MVQADFPSRINNSSSIALENISIDKYKNNDFTINPFLNGLSDHDAQILILHNTKIQNLITYSYTRRKINESTISEFKVNLSYESWDEIFIDEDVDTIFLDLYLIKQ